MLSCLYRSSGILSPFPLPPSRNCHVRRQKRVSPISVLSRSGESVLHPADCKSCSKDSDRYLKPVWTAAAPQQIFPHRNYEIHTRTPGNRQNHIFLQNVTTTPRKRKALLTLVLPKAVPAAPVLKSNLRYTALSLYTFHNLPQ